jgi:predicted transposase YbfD/YdcC
LSKKTLQLIVNSGNDYLVGIKANQPKLLNYAQTLAQQLLPDAIDIQIERTRGRIIQRSVKVYELMDGIDPSWEKAQSLIVVERHGSRDGQSFATLSYYLSSLKTSAFHFAHAIRGHRDIENGLHWIKDVVLGEDRAPIRAYNAATNWSIIRTFVINLLRGQGYRSLTKALRFLCHDLNQLFSLLTMN